MAFLPNDSVIAQGVCGLRHAYQQSLQLDECCKLDTRRTHRHCRAQHGIEHPTGDGDNDAGRP
jgi:hypothetical protein